MALPELASVLSAEQMRSTTTQICGATESRGRKTQAEMSTQSNLDWSEAEPVKARKRLRERTSVSRALRIAIPECDVCADSWIGNDAGYGPG